MLQWHTIETLSPPQSICYLNPKHILYLLALSLPLSPSLCSFFLFSPFLLPLLLFSCLFLIWLNMAMHFVVLFNLHPHKRTQTHTCTRWRELSILLLPTCHSNLYLSFSHTQREREIRRERDSSSLTYTPSHTLPPSFFLSLLLSLSHTQSAVSAAASRGRAEPPPRLESGSSRAAEPL